MIKLRKKILGHSFVLIYSEYPYIEYVCSVCSIQVYRRMNNKILKISSDKPLTITCDEQIIKTILE